MSLDLLDANLNDVRSPQLARMSTMPVGHTAFTRTVSLSLALMLLVHFGPTQVLGQQTFGTLRADRILFLGNSLTLHGPKPEIQWTGNWGMAAGVDLKVIQKRLGHRDFATTANTYSHLLQGAQDDAVAKVSGLLVSRQPKRESEAARACE